MNDFQEWVPSPDTASHYTFALPYKQDKHTGNEALRLSPEPIIGKPQTVKGSKRKRWAPHSVDFIASDACPERGLYLVLNFVQYARPAEAMCDRERKIERKSQRDEERERESERASERERERE